jgi:hypothetical protein
MTMPLRHAQTSLEGAQTKAKLPPYVERFATAKNAPLCLGCALLEMPERCVEWEGGEVRCDQCK